MRIQIAFKRPMTLCVGMWVILKVVLHHKMVNVQLYKITSIGQLYKYPGFIFEIENSFASFL